ncbi:MAG: TetR/AcrR family transcriptional regulator [Pseudomonadota bacterium]
MRLFTERGYENVSISDIASAAGIAVGTVYRFYPTKIELLRAVLEGLEDEFVSRMQADWSGGGAYGDRLDQLCLGLFDLAQSRRPLLGLFTMTTDVAYADGSLPGDRIRRQIVVMYREALGAGAFRGGDVTLYAAMAHGLVEGAIMAWQRRPTLGKRRAAGQLAEVLKHGFLAEK